MSDLVCATCNGTGRVKVPDPTASNWFPKPPMWGWCKDCDGTGQGQP